jgi:hypothetical protein
VQFYFSQNPSEKINSVENAKKKYLIYGNELKINLMEMSSVEAKNSDFEGETYYSDFDWSKILGEK